MMVRGGKSDGEIIRVIFDAAPPSAKGKPNPRGPFIIKALERPSDRESLPSVILEPPQRLAYHRANHLLLTAIAHVAPPDKLPPNHRRDHP